MSAGRWAQSSVTSDRRHKPELARLCRLSLPSPRLSPRLQTLCLPVCVSMLADLLGTVWNHYVTHVKLRPVFSLCNEQVLSLIRRTCRWFIAPISHEPKSICFQLSPPACSKHGPPRYLFCFISNRCLLAQR